MINEKWKKNKTKKRMTFEKCADANLFFIPVALR